MKDQTEDKYVYLGSRIKLPRRYRQPHLSEYDNLRKQLEDTPFHVHFDDRQCDAKPTCQLLADDRRWGEREVKFIRQLLERCVSASFFRFAIVVGNPPRLEKVFQLITTTKPVDNTVHLYEVEMTELGVDRRWTNI